MTEAQAARQAADVRTLLRSLPRRLREHVRATVHFLLHSPAVARLLLANALIGVPSFLIQMFFAAAAAGRGACPPRCWGC